MMNDNANGNITLLTFVDSCGQFGIKALETLKTSHAMIPVYSNVGCDLKKPLKMLVIRTGKRHYYCSSWIWYPNKKEFTLSLQANADILSTLHQLWSTSPFPQIWWRFFIVFRVYFNWNWCLILRFILLYNAAT